MTPTPEQIPERDLDAARTILTQLADEARITGRQITWEEVRAGLARASGLSGEWAGYPMPVDGMSMQIHPSYPFAANLGQVFRTDDYAPTVRACRNEDVDEDAQEDIQVRNIFRSYKTGNIVTIWRQGRKFTFARSAVINGVRMILDTIGAARAWDIGAEMRAVETLRKHVTEWAFNCYAMTGTFLESSPKSGLIYLFRRLRPTIAMTSKPDYWTGDTNVRILTCLCMHPIGYYRGSWAGALCPTDDLISHLLLMRSDEHLYWKQCNHIPALAPEAGL